MKLGDTFYFVNNAAYAAAVTRDQAKIVWETAWEMTRRAPEFRKHLGIGTSSNTIYQDRTASKFLPISSDRNSFLACLLLKL